jgi:hypothetical protein
MANNIYLSWIFFSMVAVDLVTALFLGKTGEKLEVAA